MAWFIAKSTRAQQLTLKKEILSRLYIAKAASGLIEIKGPGG